MSRQDNEDMHQRIIPKIPSFMRLKNMSDDYDPKVLSLGPYHHGKKELEFVEDFKPKALQMFIQGSDKDYNFFLEKILEEIERAKSCYLEEFTSKYDDCDFARMMLLDACFVLMDIEIVTEFSKSWEVKYSFTKEHLGVAGYCAAAHDLYLLENQVPFWILKLLFNLRYVKDDSISYDHRFESIVQYYCSYLCFGDHGLYKEYWETEPPHLFEVFRRELIISGDKNKDDYLMQQRRHHLHHQPPASSLSGSFSDKWKKNVQNMKKATNSHINLGCLGRYCCIREKRHHKPKTPRCVFRSVIELKTKGIHFRRSHVNSFNCGAKFHSHCYYAELWLPPWYVSSVTKTALQNMIAYEICPNSVNHGDISVTSYISFMKALITSPQDVKELREKKIIVNYLGSDEEVIQVFRSVNTYGTRDQSSFDEINLKIKKHLHSRARTWFAELVNTYFTSPWSLLTLIAATFLLFLAMVQAFYASPLHNLHPSKKFRY
ncbi:PREDICTED: UPF0481 protein At3g47200-like [Nicotiana attenuata]|uniref:Upf0481 protein n=1 Tax=Nicotiana attenuata TaxID=49451 RepID=A0A314L782_NICAT|nr:PREDICTED: UPF0481 protein At3g47200-like [Nicotiana attenuata]OIT37641.1 upf0481 protein [Nicotiana attenuata]